MEGSGAQAASANNMSEQLIAIYDLFGFPDPLRTWLLDGGVDNVEKLAGAVSEEKDIASDMIAASGCSLKIGEKSSIRLAWSEARKQSGTFNGSLPPSASAGPNNSSVQSVSRMPSGSEAHLRAQRHKAHNLTLAGRG